VILPERVYWSARGGTAPEDGRCAVAQRRAARVERGDRLPKAVVFDEMVIGPQNNGVDIVGADQGVAHQRRACRAQPVEHRARQAAVVAQDHDK
jgi:hypothetical protein